MAEAFFEPVRAVEPIRANRIDVGRTARRGRRSHPAQGEGACLNRPRATTLTPREELRVPPGIVEELFKHKETSNTERHGVGNETVVRPRRTNAEPICGAGHSREPSRCAATA